MTLKNSGVLIWRMSAGREFQTDGSATENARPLNLLTVGGTVYENVSVEHCIAKFRCSYVLSVCLSSVTLVYCYFIAKTA